jgi:hypothetical protein
MSAVIVFDDRRWSIGYRPHLAVENTQLIDLQVFK